MRKITIFIIAVLLSVGAYAADNIAGMDSVKVAKLIARNTLRGYKGFVELGMGATLHDFDYVGDGIANDNEPTGFGVEVLTTHGYQFNNFFFLGGGVGVSECTETNVMVPIFADMRINVLNRRITPVIDIKGGYAVGDHHGAFFSANIGIRIGFKGKKKSAVYVMADMSFLGDTEHGRIFNIDFEEKNLACERYSLKIGYEF